MANNNTYTWSFPAMDVTKAQGSYTDMVYAVHWRIKGADPSTSHSVELYGAQALPQYNPDSGSYIQYQNLTADVVTNWTIDAMGERYNQLTASIDSSISNLINPKTEQLPPPW